MRNVHLFCVYVCVTGREAMETVYLINNESTPFGFHFVEDSCHSEGYASHLVVEPMSGQIPPKSRYVEQPL